MALMMGKLYAALTAAGVTAEVVRYAAEEAAGVGARLVRIEGGLSTLKILVAFGLTLNIVILGLILRGNGL